MAQGSDAEKQIGIWLRVSTETSERARPRTHERRARRTPRPRVGCPRGFVDAVSGKPSLGPRPRRRHASSCCAPDITGLVFQPSRPGSA